MLLREDHRGLLAIGQFSHSWVSGQLARAWGNALFGEVSPREEVTLAAEQHDIGMSAWDVAPTLNPETGLPYAFTEMPLDLHLQHWRAGPRQLLSQSRYAALLASLHGLRLYERRDVRALPEAEADAIRSYLAEQREFQAQLLDSLRTDPATTASAASEVLARNSQLIWTWDLLSLALCLDWAPYCAPEVPTAESDCEMRLTSAGQRGRLSLDPWPFAEASVTVRCEGRRLEGRFASDDALEQALARAPWETVQFELVRP